MSYSQAFLDPSFTHPHGYNIIIIKVYPKGAWDGEETHVSAILRGSLTSLIPKESIMLVWLARGDLQVGEFINS